MSEEQLSGKAKKAKRSEERFKKNKKKEKNTDITEGGDVATEVTEPVVESGEKKKKSKKRSRDEVDDVDGEEKSKEVTASTQKDAAPKLHKKQKKDNPNLIKTGGEEETEQQPSGKHRFIVFIGNLPFSATTETITKHFASVSPASVRHITDQKTKKSKGFAFLEFDNYDKMKTCLKLYHHSTFESGFEKEKKRKINVELTAGGGGKSDQRKEKLKTKNEKLTEERQRRAEAEAKQENRKLKKSDKGKQGEVAAVPDEVPEPEQAPVEEGMHPSRMAMIQRGR